MVTTQHSTLSFAMMHHDSVEVRPITRGLCSTVMGSWTTGGGYTVTIIDQ